ncbi:MAG: C40 family peptidase [Actinobacteria bacterium]|nr:C40 family peptidase [Actinomycetota bacterium]
MNLFRDLTSLGPGIARVFAAGVGFVLSLGLTVAPAHAEPAASSSSPSAAASPPTTSSPTTASLATPAAGGPSTGVIANPTAPAATAGGAGPRLPGAPPVLGSSPNPSAAAAAKAARDRVAALQAQVEKAQTTIAEADNAAALAEQSYAAAQEKLSNARSTEVNSLLLAGRSRMAADTARRELVDTLVQTYEGYRFSNMSALLISPDPGRAVTAVAYTQLLDQRHSTLTADAIRTRDGFASAERRAAEAMQAQADATHASATALSDARAADQTAKSTFATLQVQLQAAQATEAETAAALLFAQFGPVAPLSASDQAALMAAYRDKAQQVARLPMASSTGSWSAAVGQSVVDRALQWLGTPYSFAGGSPAGPTLGVDSAGAGAQDGSVVGFDCSGLSLYAWAPYTKLVHFAATQYATAGRLHPSVAELLPGDLVFWSGDRTAGGISHVAVYVGEGDVIQAPQSGEVVEITPLASVESGYFGATRPLS